MPTSPLSVLEAAKWVPDRPALIAPGVTWSFGQLAERVLALGPRPSASSWMRPMSRDPGDLIEIYRALAYGHRLGLIHPQSSAAERERLCARFGFSAPAPSLDPSFGQFVLFTSGSSAAPKAVLLSRGALLQAAEASAKRLGFSPPDRWLLSLPVAHIGGLSILIRSLVMRCPMVLGPSAFSVEAWDALIRAHSVSALSMVPTQLYRWVKRGLPPPPSLRFIMLGGAPASLALMQEARAQGLRLAASFGMTESAAAATLSFDSRSAGHPLDSLQLRIHEGEIQLKGPQLFSGYLQESGALLDARDREGWFPTGDLGHLDAQGALWVTGRRSEMILTGGENVHPREVEQVVEQQPGVKAALVFGDPDPEWGEVVSLAVVWEGPPQRDALWAALKAELPGFRRPRRLAELEMMPKTPSGKLDKPRIIEAARAKLRPF